MKRDQIMTPNYLIDTLSKEESEMTERISLEGKVAVVTGAGRGLGRAYVELLADTSVPRSW